MDKNETSINQNTTPHARVEKEQIQFLTPAQVMELDDPKWLIDGVLPESSIAVLVGAAGGGKTFLALDWAFSIATSTQWGQRHVASGPVVYVYAEGVAGLKYRLAAWKKDKDVSPENIHFVPKSVKIGQRGGQQDLLADNIKNILGISPALIVLDTLARCFCGSEENSASEMQGFVNGMDYLRNQFGNCTILTLHHPPKGKTNDPRGSSALEGAADTIVTFDGKKLACEKQKDGEHFSDISISKRVVNLTGDRSSLVFDINPGIGIEEPANDNSTNNFIKWINRKRDKSDTTLRLLTCSPERGLSHGEWKKVSMENGISKSSFDRSLTKLLETGKVQKLQNRYQAIKPEKTEP
jgi:hypothetical protein